MTITEILSFLKGSVVIEAEGAFLERFLNICMRRNIYLSDINHLSDEKIRAGIGIEGFRQIRPIAKKTRTRVKIKKRMGLPFLLHRYRKRRFVLAGLLLFFVVLGYLATHIIGIDIIGNERILASDIEQELKNFGLYRGARASSIDNRLLQNKMMTSFDDLAWIGINIKGSRAYIEVKERLATKMVVGEDVPCNIVASRDGVIRGLQVRSGQTMVEVNQAVEEGELLVSGVIDSGVYGIRWEHSSANVYAETFYEKSREYPLSFTEKVYTGQEKTRYSIGAWGKKIKLFLNDAQPFEYSDKTSEESEYHLFSPKIFSTELLKETYKEYVPQKRTRTELEAAERGKKELLSELEKELPESAEVLKRDASYVLVSPECVRVTVKLVCKEDIARQKLIERENGADSGEMAENN